MLEMVLGSRIVFAGRLDADTLSRATRILLDLEPVLGCRYSAGPLRAQWLRCPDVDGSQPFRLVETRDPDAEAASFHSTPFASKAPRLAAALLRCADHDELCVRFDHVAGDGWSAKEVTCLLAETYTRLLKDPLWIPQTRLAPRPTHTDVWKALTDEQRSAAANMPKMEFSDWSARFAHGTGSVFAARSLTLDPDRVSGIRAYAHARGATLNEALVAAFLRSVAAISPPPAGTRPGVSISADSRRIAADPTLNRIANIATTQTVLMDYRYGETFDETLEHVVEGAKPWRDCLWSVGGFFGRKASDPKPPSPIFLRAMFRFLTTSMRVGHAAALVTMNVGPLDEARLAFGSVLPESAVIVGPIPRFSGFATTISSYRDELTLWMGFREKHIRPELIEQCLTGVDEQLASALGTDPS